MLDLYPYAGIGSRQTPPDALASMTRIAEQLGHRFLLRSGHADGADQAFERGAVHKEIHLPWAGYNNAPRNSADYIVPQTTNEIVEIAARHHPNWENLSNAVRLLMVRNTTIVLGQDLHSYAKMVVCWTQGGRLIGGTSHAMRVAYAFDIPVFNIALVDDQHKLCEFLQF